MSILLVGFIFALAMGYAEAAVVVYLRELYYPEGFSLPLKVLPKSSLLLEIGREVATLAMLMSVSVAVAKNRWERFGACLFMFGLWDIWYYIWLKLMVNWPSSLLDWDVLFLIPIPWLGPVIAPLLIALTMVVIGVRIVRDAGAGVLARPGKSVWSLSLCGTAILLYSFMHDTGASLNQEIPQPYPYWLLAVGLACYWFGFILFVRRKRGPQNARMV